MPLVAYLCQALWRKLEPLLLLLLWFLVADFPSSTFLFWKRWSVVTTAENLKCSCNTVQQWFSVGGKSGPAFFSLTRSHYQNLFNNSDLIQKVKFLAHFLCIDSCKINIQNFFSQKKTCLQWTAKPQPIQTALWPTFALEIRQTPSCCACLSEPQIPTFFFLSTWMAKWVFLNFWFLQSAAILSILSLTELSEWNGFNFVCCLRSTQCFRNV